MKSCDFLDSAVLGETSNRFILEGLEDIKQALSFLTQQAQRSLKIVSSLLPPDIYEDGLILDNIPRIARRSRFSQVQILVHDSQPAHQINHRIIPLIKRLPSFIELRLLPPYYHEDNKSFVIADDIGMAFELESPQSKAFIEFYSALAAKREILWFNEAWDKGLNDPNLRTIRL